MTLSESQRRLRKSKESERELARWLMLNDGPDARYEGLTTSTGRIGHLTHLQFDVPSHTYAAENKNVRITADLAKWWQQIIDVAKSHDKRPLLRLDPSNVGRLPVLHIITPEHHAELLAEWRV